MIVAGILRHLKIFQYIPSKNSFNCLASHYVISFQIPWDSRGREREKVTNQAFNAVERESKSNILHDFRPPCCPIMGNCLDSRHYIGYIISSHVIITISLQGMKDTIKCAQQKSHITNYYNSTVWAPILLCLTRTARPVHSWLLARPQFINNYMRYTLNILESFINIDFQGGMSFYGMGRKLVGTIKCVVVPCLLQDET